MEITLIDQIVESLMNNHGFGKEKALELIHKHIDIVEVNKGESPSTIAQKLEEQYLQED
jgi:hypothetical protein